MEAVFLKILNMSITAGWLVLAVLVLRLIFKKAPKALSVLMWALVGIRLICPFSIESALSLIPSAQTVPEQILTEQTPAIQSGVPVFNNAVNPVIGEALEATASAAVTPVRSITRIAALIWLVGVGLMLAYAAFSYLRIRKRVREAVPVAGKLWLCDHIQGPFILGILRPRIYLPSDLDAADLEYVVVHENAHLKRRDHWWKPLGFLLLAVHWFNPLLWLGYILLCRDIEAACDEAVIHKLGADAKKPYSEALIQCSVSRRSLAACPLAFGEVGVKQRIKSVLSYKKPALWIILAAVTACIALAVGFLTDPKTAVSSDLRAWLYSQVKEHHQSEDSRDHACCLDIEILDARTIGNKTTVYFWALYEEYTLREGELYGETGSHIITAVTVEDTSHGYTLVEYWEPRDGSYYASDIRRKIPLYLWSKAFDSQRYVAQQQKNCEEAAWAQLLAEDNATLSETASPAVIEALKKKYPEYFGLSTTKGLEVYVWQMAENAYSWAVREGKNLGYTQLELMSLPQTSLEEIRAIVASYQLTRSQVSIIPVQMPHSSYGYVIDEAYREKVEALFWGDDTQIPKATYDYIIDFMTFDIDGDGVEEHCTLGPGITSGLFTFTLSVTEKGEPEYYNVFSSPFYYLSFAKTTTGEVQLRGQTQGTDPQVHYFRFGVENGNITLSSDEQTVAYWGEQGFSDGIQLDISMDGLLELAIDNALRDRYESTVPDGLIHTQSYALLEQERVSGTPLMGQTEHAQEVTVYLLVLHMDYSLQNGLAQEVDGSFAPTAITFTVDAEGNYILRKYWSKEQGTYTPEELREKFPEDAAQQALDLDRYAEELKQRCFAQAEAWLADFS